jgi:amino acid transporter
MDGVIKMNRTQKITFIALAAYLFAGVMIICAIINMFSLQANTITRLGAHLSMAAVFAMPVIAYFTLRRKQSPAEPDSDERDETIKQKATSVAFLAVCMFLLAASVIPFLFVGQRGSIPAVAMPVINLGIFIITMAVYSMAVLVQYRRGLPPRLSSRDEAAGGKQNE